MRLRLTKVDEFQFLICIKHQVWGSKNAHFAQWKPGDYLAIIVDKAVAGLAQVAGAPYVSHEPVWDNGVFPHRVPLQFVHAMLPPNRPPMLGPIRDTLTSAWGVNPQQYGWAILNQQLLDGDPAAVIVNAITQQPNDLASIQSDLEQLLVEADEHRSTRPKAPKAKPPAPPGVQEVRAVREKPAALLDTEPAAVARPDEERAHAKAQHALIQLGKVTGCSVWVASNDRNRLYQGQALGNGCLIALPNMGFDRDATARIALIDVIWIRHNAPVCAFEVETTTTVYSGLLRMSDLLALVPAIKIELFIVAPRARQDKVMDELGRPTFRKIGLSDFCRFIATEDLDTLVARVGDLAGHVQPSIVSTIAVSLPGEPVTALQ
jgi:hypothetical protein